MNKKYSYTYISLSKILFILIALIFFQCSKKKEEQSKALSKQEQAELYREYVSSYTTGVISSHGEIRIRLANSNPEIQGLAEKVPSGFFSFEPKISGKAYWADKRTIIFKPAKPLKQKQTYNVVADLSKVLPIAEENKYFEFSFKTIVQNFEVKVDGLQLMDMNDPVNHQLQGKIYTADFAENEQIEKVLTAYQEDNSLSISWEHPSNKENIHNFFVKGIKRKKEAGNLLLKWNGKALGMKLTGNKEVEIPALGDFKILQARAVQGGETHISLEFSDALRQNQDLEGLIRVESRGNIQKSYFLIIGNKINVFTHERLTGKVNIQVNKEVFNLSGYKLQEDFEANLLFSQEKPAVRFVGKGVILPNTQGLVIPFEAVSLKAVDVKVIRIFENNVLQFLQSNQLDGSQELIRVGRPVAGKTIYLNTSGITNLGEWNRFTLDLAELITVEPGAIYQVELGFRHAHSAYYCEQEIAQADEGQTMEEDWDFSEADLETTNWDSYEDYYSYDYDWYQRDNPCHSAYYRRERSVKRNVLASDLGLIAKQGENGVLHAFVTDLKNTEPLGGVDLEVYDYQQQVMATSVSSNDGKAELALNKKPFVLMAKQGEQRAYLKLDPASSLSLSNFDVAGQKVKKGIKGFLYGERGVWRPGDTLHLTFMLEDLEKRLPKVHPVVLELSDPYGQLVHRMVQKDHISGIYAFHIPTDFDYRTGNWTAVVKVGGSVFRKSLRLETVKPNRLKINLDFKTNKLTQLEKAKEGDLQVNWLHGAPAQGLRANFQMTLVRSSTAFKAFPNYIFDDLSRDFRSETTEIFDGKVNEDGFAKINLNLETPENAPGMLNAVFKGKVFEEGGDFSIDRFSIPYYPYASFVGLRLPEGDKRGMLETDKDIPIRIVSVDANGAPISRQNVEVEVYKLNWRWWWDKSEDDIANYLGRSYKSPVFKGKTSTNKGKGNVNFQIKYPDWGRYYVRVFDPVSGHSAGKIVYIDWPGWAGRQRKSDADGASMLTFSSDKDEYAVGEEISLSIPGSNQGRALVSIENGNRVLKSWWVEMKEGENTVKFEAESQMAPNFYAHVTLLQPHDQSHNDLPMRLYGVIPIGVSDPETHLEPKIDMADLLKPEQEVNIKVSEANGKAMAYTLAVVEDGLLDLTKFKTPKPWEHFYSREALGVKSWDFYDKVIGAYGGELEHLLAIGGDDELSEEEERKTNRFKPVVKFLGPFKLDEGKTKNHKFQMPQYIGSVRTMVIAAQDGAYGTAEKTTPVKEALMVLGTLPRLLGPGEKIKLPVNVFVHDEGIKSVKLKVKGNEKLKVTGARAKSIAFQKPGNQVVEFSMETAESTGLAKVEIEAIAGKHKATYEVELDVRSANPKMTKVVNKFIEAGESWKQDYQPFGLVGTNEATLEVSRLPAINLKQRLAYLIRYPHGCVEQTVSSVFAQLFLPQLMDLSDDEKLEIQSNVTAAINRLLQFQTSEGVFAYWPGLLESNEWGTNYAGHFLTLAKDKGYSVPESMFTKWVEYQKDKANRWKVDSEYSRDDLIQAYRLYTLALAQEEDRGTMNRLRTRDNLSPQAKWKLAAAYAIMGLKEVAKGVIEDVNKEVKPYRELSGTFGSALRDRAMILETLSLLGMREEGIEILSQIAKELSNGQNWISTQATAYSLIAVADFVQLEEENKYFNFALTQPNGKVNHISSGRLVSSNTLEAENPGNILLENSGETPLYARLILEGQPLEGQEETSAKNLEIMVNYLNKSGEEIDINQLEQGTDFEARVTVYNPGLRGVYKEMALSQVFPAGWEILNSRLMGDENGQSTPEYQDIRDDKVLTLF
ncbi:alpha-2-macroglobulin family protein [Xanthovirga aplysinae]|uniref:alpha-2-macroglobulin family protein n=1 Tax=Xanthovirga aplysinae TaxID=2529853 RepID=UPI0012BB68F2|nr:MG2 domain-containing protein [Xanthovirga aplysinae]MTI31571.1 hypothetical protein [Xanthovirga aplysinae]